MAYFGRTESVDLNGNGDMDALYMAGDDVIVQWAPGKLVAKDVAFEDCLDFDVIPAVGTARPAIVVLDTDGIWMIDIVTDAGSGQLVWHKALTVPGTVGHGSLMRVGDLDKDSDSDLVVWDSNTSFVHVLDNRAGSWVLLAGSFSVTGAIQDFVLYDRFGGSLLLELVMRTVNGAKIVGLDGF